MEVLIITNFIYRENRIRAYLGVRYDHCSGVFDWDYNMKILDLVSAFLFIVYLSYNIAYVCHG